jgi:uncharacterized NAD(P)/FAD-binding protein YdhS
VAYQHDFLYQPLNVVAAGMSLLPDRPHDFLDWLRSNHFRYNYIVDEVLPTTFVSRKVFGDYVIERLDEAHRAAAGRFQIRIDEVISIRDTNGMKTAVLASGAELQANHIVLALGNFPPADLFQEESTVNTDPRYFSNPWSDRVYSHIRGDEDILIVGSGLTAVDVLLGLKRRRFNGRITMLSRRGRLPMGHDLTHPPFPVQPPESLPPAHIFRWLRNEIQNHPEVSWVSIIDGLRPHTQRIWQGWSAAEKKYFLRRLRPLWEVSRHRIPMRSTELLDEMMRNGQLRLIRGHVLDGQSTADGLEIRYLHEQEEKRSLFHKVINCTGPESNYRKLRFTIIRDLMEKGKVTADDLGLGIACTADGHVINSEGKFEPGLWCIGPMRKSALWESTALREIREQAAAFAQLLS